MFLRSMYTAGNESSREWHDTKLLKQITPSEENLIGIYSHCNILSPLSTNSSEYLPFCCDEEKCWMSSNPLLSSDTRLPIWEKITKITIAHWALSHAASEPWTNRPLSELHLPLLVLRLEGVELAGVGQQSFDCLLYERGGNQNRPMHAWFSMSIAAGDKSAISSTGFRVLLSSFFTEVYHDHGLASITWVPGVSVFAPYRRNTE